MAGPRCQGRRRATTIAAPATPPGSGRRAALRVSGPLAGELLRGVLRDAGPTVVVAPDSEPNCESAAADSNDLTESAALRERTIFEGRFDDGRGTQPVLVLWMPGPGSYTGEDVVEFHLPGSPPLVEVAWRRLLELGAVPAEPGEFTRRAFMNGRMDLTRAEGVLELVHAASESRRRAAAALLDGGLERRTQALRERLEELRALCEASLDFDEADTGHVPAAMLEELAAEAAAGLSRALAWETAREPARGAPRVVLTGAPNAGKSALFNRLTGGRALVSERAGTTRDWLAGTWVVRGVELELVDAAGLEPAQEAGGPDSESQERGEPGVEQRAQELAAGRRRGADLLLWVVDATAPEGAEPPAMGAGQGGDEHGDEGGACPTLLVWNKVDRDSATPAPDAALSERAAAGACAVSALTGAGLADLEEHLAEALGLGDGRALGEAAGVARSLSARHRGALEAAASALELARAELATGIPLDLVAEGLRAATDALDGITGRTTPEDLLDRIFARFCLGK